MNAELLKIAIRYEQEWALPQTSVVDFITELELEGWKIARAVSEGTPQSEGNNK